VNRSEALRALNYPHHMHLGCSSYHLTFVLAGKWQTQTLSTILAPYQLTLSGPLHSKSPASRCGCLRTRSSAARRVKLHLYRYLCGNEFAVFGRGGKSPSVHCFHRSRIKRGTQRARDSKVMWHALSVDDATQFNTAFMTRIPLSFGILWLGRVSCTRWRCTVGRISVIATTPLRVAPHRLTLSSVFARS
jgi:hypothetical protein